MWHTMVHEFAGKQTLQVIAFYGSCRNVPGSAEQEMSVACSSLAGRQRRDPVSDRQMIA